MLLLILCISVLSISIDVAQGTCVDVPQIPAGFTVHKVLATWEQAQANCQKRAGVLASPLTEEMLNVMISWNGVNNTEYFIGAKASNATAPFVSVEGIPIENMPSKVMDMIQQIDTNEGRCLSMDRNNIRVVPCCKRLPYMCYNALATIDPTIFGSNDENSNAEPAITNRDCDTDYEGYIYIPGTGSCYKKHMEAQRPWKDAQSVCQVEDAHLLVLDNDEEARAIQTLNLTDIDPAFIGLRDDGGWKSVTGKPMSEIYNKWHYGQPVNPTMGCGVLYKTGLIDNLLCYVEKYFICEKEL